MMRKCILSVLVAISFSYAHGQHLLERLMTQTDSTYISDKSDMLTLRVFMGQKHSRYALGNWKGDMLNYESNDHYNVGFGFNYSIIGLNIAIRMPLANHDPSRFGKTRFFDLQTYVYLRKVVADIYHQNYKGFYIQNRSALQSSYSAHIQPQRGDLYARHTGVNVQYIFNPEKFSYRAAYVQNEYQKKSAGSFLAGAGLHFSRVQADSSLIPGDIAYPDFFDNKQFNRTDCFNINLHAGYAYTLVMTKHFFISGSFLLSGGLNYALLHNGHTGYRQSGIHLHTGGQLRLAAGYNSEIYYVGVQYISFINRNNLPPAASWQQYETGNFRLNLVKRFALQGKMKKRVHAIEKMLKSEKTK